VRPWRLLTQDIAISSNGVLPMADRDQSRQPTHRAYSVIKREGQDDFWLNLGLAFAHKDGKGLNIILQAFPLDGKIVLREPSEDEQEKTGDVRGEDRARRSGSR
jgi:hypothetical protein